MASEERGGLPQGDIEEYARSLMASEKFGSQVVYCRDIAASSASYAELSQPLPEAVRQALRGLGIDKLYRHQVEAIDRLRAGEDVIVATPTASGKSLIYNIPVFSHILENPGARALYLFPLKALAQDQLAAFEKMALFSGMGRPPRAAIYDGDTTAYSRRKIRELPPEVLFSNPDMLHLSLMAHQENWGSFFAGLSYVVIDEVHTYRGVFGSHVAWVMRRLRRLCHFYGSDPIFILSSATVGNPGELAEKIIGRPVHSITESGAPQGARRFIFLDPQQGAAYAASQLLEAALKRGLRTIVYSQSRKITELISMWTAGRLGPLREKLAAYRAGFLPEDRRKIEAKLADGSLLGVVSTSALELGIDIGELELCIMAGYPGSIMAAWQRGGRVGRRHTASLIVLIAQEDSLDKYFMRHPAEFFSRKVEDAILNPQNRVIAKLHLTCMAAEGALAVDEPVLAEEGAGQALAELAAEGRLLLDRDGGRWYASRRYPQRQVDLRGSGSSFLLLGADGKVFGEVDGARVYKECHPGAVYLHMGRTYVVETLDIQGGRIRLMPRKVNYFTRALSAKETEILEVKESRVLGPLRVSWGRLRITERVGAFQRVAIRGHRLLGTERLHLPTQVTESEGVWLHLPAGLEDITRRQRSHFPGAIHALEHAMIGCFPLLVLCDRNDIGGLSTPYHQALGSGAIFIYDGAAGGVGLCRQAFAKVELLLNRTLEVISSCPCDSGCPSCVHSPKCGSGNRPIDKGGAALIGRALMGEKGVGQLLPPPEPLAIAGDDEEGGAGPLSAWPCDYGVFDVETKRAAAEVGGWGNAGRMGVSVVVLYDSRTDDYTAYEEEQLPKFFARLLELPLVVGFNNLRFDNQVLQPYTSLNLANLPSVDILQEVRAILGYRLSLDRLARETLGTEKSADGLQALRWYREGKMAEIAAYCKVDVEITRDLFLHGMEKGYLLFKDKQGRQLRCPFGER